MMECVITLVHGTWARDAPWTRDVSPLCCRLRDALPSPIRFERFNWSGRNSFSARHKASEHLRAHLHRLFDQWPAAKHYVIAHSHGGNVVFYAMRDPDIASRLAGVICLSTPFLHATTRDLGPYALIPLFLAGMFLLGSFPLSIFAIALTTTWPWLGELPEWYGVVMTGVWLVLVGVLVLKWWRWVEGLRSRLMLPTPDTARVLFIRSTGDEASGALTTMQFSGWLLNRPWILLNNLVGHLERKVMGWRNSFYQNVHRSLRGKIAVCLCVVAAFLGLFMLQGSLLAQEVGIALMVPMGAVLFVHYASAYVVGIPYLVLALLLMPLLLISAVILLPFAPEAVLASPFMDIKIEATPPGTWTIAQLGALSYDDDGTEVVERGLSHSETYTDPRSLTLIVEWMRSRSPHCLPEDLAV